MYDRDNDIERIFYEDSRDKKRTESGIYHRASRLGYIRGGMKTQIDYLKGKAKKEYMKAGIIVEYNIYDDINNIPKDFNFFYEMDFEKAKNILAYIKEKHMPSKLAKHFGVSPSGLYTKFWYKYGLVTKPTKADKIKELMTAPAAQEEVVQAQPAPTNFEIVKVLDGYKEQLDSFSKQAAYYIDNQNSFIAQQQNVMIAYANKLSEAQKSEAAQEGFSTSLNGIFLHSDLEARLFGILQSLGNTEGNKKFKITFRIQEIMEQP